MLFAFRFPEKVIDIDALQEFKPKAHLKLAERMKLNLVEGVSYWGFYDQSVFGPNLL
jgi:hypothetical protein